MQPISSRLTKRCLWRAPQLLWVRSLKQYICVTASSCVTQLRWNYWEQSWTKRVENIWSKRKILLCLHRISTFASLPLPPHPKLGAKDHSWLLGAVLVVTTLFWGRGGGLARVDCAILNFTNIINLFVHDCSTMNMCFRVREKRIG